jgi:hypothetical protein
MRSGEEMTGLKPGVKALLKQLQVRVDNTDDAIHACPVLKGDARSDLSLGPHKLTSSE